MVSHSATWGYDKDRNGTVRALIRYMPLFSAVLAFSFALWGGTLFGQALSFLPPVNVYNSGYSRATSMCESCVATADFNSDGKVDIVYAGDLFIPFIGVSLGNGDGTFRPAAPFPAIPASGTPFVADFNGDGKPDIAIYNRIYLGDGTGKFNEPLTVAACFGLSAVADLNRDGKQDLICGSSILLSDGDGTFHTVPGTLAGNAVLVADFNGDRNVDLLLRAGTGSLAVVLGRGDGTFGPAMAVSGFPNLQTVRAGDFNGDGRTDLVGPSADGTMIVVLLGHGDGTFGPALTTGGIPGPITAVADFNHDGKQDLVAGDAVLAGNGDGTFRFPVFIGVVTQACGPLTGPGGAPCDYSHVATVVADFNGDGLPDIAAGYIARGITSTRVASVSILLNGTPGDGLDATGISSATLTWPVGPGSLVSAFGANLAPGTEAAATNPAPATLGGIRVHVRDRSHANDSLAPLLYVSPTQINYVLTSTDPYAWVSIERVGSPYVPKGISVPISRLAPGLFALGSGLAAASAVRIAADGTQTLVTVTSCTGQVCTSEPIDLSGDPVYLSLYGTGFAQASTESSICGIAGQTLPASYAGPQTQIAGLDQINVLLPRNLQGAGDTSIACSFGTAQRAVVSNAVKLKFR